MIIKDHINKVCPKAGNKSGPNLAHNIYYLTIPPSLPLISQPKKSCLVRSVWLVSLDALALLAISVSLYYLAVGSCLLDDACYTMYYGVSQ